MKLMTFSHSSDATIGLSISTSLKILSHKVIQKSPPNYINKTTEHMKAESRYLNTKDNGILTGFISQI